MSDVNVDRTRLGSAKHDGSTVISSTKQSWHAVGRRKRASGNVHLTKHITPQNDHRYRINGRSLTSYLNEIPRYSLDCLAPMQLLDKSVATYDLNIRVRGGGLTCQAQAIRLAISRGLLQLSEETNNDQPLLSKALLKRKGFLTCDARVKERKKCGYVKARKAPQFSKR